MNGHLLSWIGLAPLLVAAALLPAPPAHAQDAGWQLAPDVTCVWRSCATFTPSSGGTTLEQSWWSPLAIDRPGILVFPPGYSTLKRPSTQQVLTIGPGSLLYHGGSVFRALQPLYVRYEHPSSEAAPLEISLPTVILGTEGTVFRIEPEGTERMTVTVEKGDIQFRWIDAPFAPPSSLPEGQALNTSSLEPRAFTLQSGSTRGIRPSYRAATSLKALPKRWSLLKAQLDAELQTGRAALPPEALTMLAADFLPTWSKEERIAAAFALADSMADPPLVGRVIFQLWLQARLLEPQSEQTAALQTLLQDRFAQTSWPAALEGVLALEAMRALHEREQDGREPDGREPDGRELDDREEDGRNQEGVEGEDP